MGETVFRIGMLVLFALILLSLVVVYFKLKALNEKIDAVEADCTDYVDDSFREFHDNWDLDDFATHRDIDHAVEQSERDFRREIEDDLQDIDNLREGINQAGKILTSKITGAQASGIRETLDEFGKKLSGV